MAHTISQVAPTPIAADRVSGISPAVWRWIRRTLLLAALIGVAFALRLTYFRPSPVPVTVVQVETGRVEELVTNNKAGTVNARRRAALAPEIAGRVVRLPVTEGDRVKRGDVLIALSDTELLAQITLLERSLEATRAAVVEACTTADLAGRELDRTRRLESAGYLSRQALDEAESRATATRATCTSSQVRITEAEARIDLARVNLTKAVLRAPFAGVVSRVSTELGEWISPSPSGLVLPTAIELIDTRSIYVRAPLDEVDAGKIRIGLPVRITMDGYPGQTFPGHVTYVGSYVSEAQQQNRTFDVDAEFDDEAFARTLLPGTSADVEVILRTHDDVLRVPTSSILQGGRVLVVRDETLVSVPVKSGVSNWQYTEVLSGIERGDDVVISLDRAEVRAGAPVRVEREVAQ